MPGPFGNEHGERGEDEIDRCLVVRVALACIAAEPRGNRRITSGLAGAPGPVLLDNWQLSMRRDVNDGLVANTQVIELRQGSSKGGVKVSDGVFCTAARKSRKLLRTGLRSRVDKLFDSIHSRMRLVQPVRVRDCTRAL